MNFEKLNTWSLIRIYNWEENEWGQGEQIEKNDEESIYDMQENFNWSEQQIFRSYKTKNYNKNEPFILCSFDGFESLTEEEVRNQCLHYIDEADLCNGELKEIVLEEFELNEVKYE